MKESPPYPLLDQQAIKKRRKKIVISVSAVHVVLLLGPMLFYFFFSSLIPAEEVAYKVSLEGIPSTDVEAGKPERAPPPSTPSPPTPPTPTPPTPEIPKPTPPTPDIPKPSPRPSPVAVPTPPKPSPPKPTTAKPTPAKPTPAKPTTAAKPQNTKDQVFNDNFNPNSMVPIGTKNVGQKVGKPDNATPAGGGGDDASGYANKIGDMLTKYLGSNLASIEAGQKEIHLKIDITADGKVLKAELVGTSGSKAFDDLCRARLAQLPQLPAPGRPMSLDMILKPEK